MAANEPEKRADPAFAPTLASGDIPRTRTPETDPQSRDHRVSDASGRDPALAATMTPEVASAHVSRSTSTLTSEHPGRYVRQAELGRGGMGRVIVVKDTHLGREVALKELLDQSAPGNDAMSIGSAARFLREARITGQLEHPGIVPVHELGQRADGTIYYTMKRIRGRSLASVLKEKTSLAERLTLLGVFRAVCEAVAYAHSHGVVHRDLKPDNVMVGEFGDTLVVDWGLAKVRGETEIAREPISGQSGRASVADDMARTLDGHAIGTPAYMSPEQARGELGSIDERADVWGLGAILFEILCGRPPYVGTSAFDVLAKVLDTPPPRVREAAADAPAELAAIVDRALMRDASSRYPNAGEVAKEIGAYLDGRTVGAYEYSAYELLMRFVRRHRAASLAALATLLSIVIASVLVYQSFLDEARARAIAETARDEAMQQRSSAEDSMHSATSAVADALLERAERALAEGDASGAAVFAAGVLVRDADSAMHAPASRRVRALSLHLEADARRGFAFEQRVPGGHWRSALSTDGRRIAIPTESAVRLVNLDDGSEQRVELHATRIRVLGSSGLAVIAGNAPGIYDLTTGELVQATASPTSAAITASAIVIASADGEIVLFSPDGRQELDRWTSGYRGQVRVTLSPAGDHVAVLSTDVPEVEIWPLPRGGALPQQVVLRALPYLSAFSPHGDRLAVLASDFVASMHLDRGGIPHVRELSTRTWPTAMVWQSDGALALFENGDHIALRDPSDGHTLDVVHLPSANGGRIETGGQRLVFFPNESGGLRDAIVLHDVGISGGEAVTLDAGVRDVQVDSARHRVVAATLSAVWTLPLGASGHLGAPVQLFALPDGVGIVERLSVADDGSIAVLTLRGGLVLAGADGSTPTIARQPVQDYSRSVSLTGLAVSTNGGQEIFCGAPGGGRVLRWSRRTSSEGVPITVAEGAVGAIAISADGAHLAAGSHDGSLRILSTSTGAIEHTVTPHGEPISAITFSPRGDRLAAASESGEIRILDAHDGHVILTAQPQERFVNGLAWSPDGRWIVSTSDDRTVDVLSVTDLTPARIVRTMAAPITAAFGPDSSQLFFHDGRSVVHLDLRMAMDAPSPTALLQQSEERAGVHLDGLTLAARAAP